MNSQWSELYGKIVAFEFDEPGVLRTFAARLAEENDWPSEFADRAIAEYRRFLVLSVAAGHVVCPSEEVDEVWHLHLQYSRNYWHKLCGEVLEKPLHHEPSRGGPDECAKHRTMYRETLTSYRRIFGEEPPADLWPGVTERFTAERLAQHVDRQRYWLIRKPEFGAPAAKLRRALRTGAIGLALAAVPLPLIGAAVNPFNFKGPEFLTLYIPLLLAVFALSLLIRCGARYAGILSLGAEKDTLGPYEAAYLNGGARRTFKAAVARLVADGSVMVSNEASTALRRAGPLNAAAHPLESAIYAAVPDATRDAQGRVVRREVADAITQIAEPLHDKGLVMPPHRVFLANTVPLVMMAAVILFGVAKIAIGVERSRPVGFLIVICSIATLVTLPLLVRPVHRTHVGDQRLQSLQSAYSHLRNEAQTTTGFSARDSLALAVGLYGFGVLTNGPMSYVALAIDSSAVGDEWCATLKRRTGDSTGAGAGGYTAGCSGGGHGCGGGGGGCGGGGCGGGCGGCGS